MSKLTTFSTAIPLAPMPEDVAARIQQARVELTLTAAFYCAVSRLLDALRVPVETAPAPPSPNTEEDQA